MEIQQDWDNTHFTDYLLYDLWPKDKAWALLAGFDWFEDVDSMPEFFPFFGEGEEGYEDDIRIYAEEKRIYGIKKENFRRLRNFWITGLKSEDSQSPKYFIDWALSKRFRPDWLDWAIEKKLYIPQAESINQLEILEKPLSTRTENNYLRLIMQLANNIKGFNPQKPHEAATLIVDNTETYLDKKTIASYIQKAYELESKESE